MNQYVNPYVKQYEVVEIVRDRNTRNAHQMKLLYGPYNTETPGVDDDKRRKWAWDRAEDDMQKAELEGYEITSVRVFQPPGGETS